MFKSLWKELQTLQETEHQEEQSQREVRFRPPKIITSTLQSQGTVDTIFELNDKEVAGVEREERDGDYQDTMEEFDYEQSPIFAVSNDRYEETVEKVDIQGTPPSPDPSI